MAKLTAPLLSLKAYGQLTKDFVLRRSKSIHVAEKKPIPADANTVSQQVQRTLFQIARDEWKLLTPAEKAEYERYGTQHHMTGYAWYMRAFLLNPAPRTFLQLEDTPASYAGQSLKIVSVKAAEDGLEFATISGADYPMKLKPNLTRYVIPGWYIYTVITMLQTAGRINYIPIFVSEQTTYTSIGINVVTLSAGTARLGIFAWNDGIPGDQILNAGTVNTGSIGIKEIAINITLERGYYFLAIRCSATPYLYGAALMTPITAPVPGFNLVQATSTPYLILCAINEWADPAPAPTGALGAAYCNVFLREN